jgi:hypothetical protein
VGTVSTLLYESGIFKCYSTPTGGYVDTPNPTIPYKSEATQCKLKANTHTLHMPFQAACSPPRRIIDIAIPGDIIYQPRHPIQSCPPCTLVHVQITGLTSGNLSDLRACPETLYYRLGEFILELITLTVAERMGTIAA